MFVFYNLVQDNFEDILSVYTKQGYRVIALAHKKLEINMAKIAKVERYIDFLAIKAFRRVL